MTALFISHASEDAASVARPLADELLRRNLEVWYDEYSLGLGDSLSREIERGLSRCDFGVVVLSPAFFERHWTAQELEALVTREMLEGQKRLLPVWHNVDIRDVAKYSILLAGRLGVRTSLGLPKVADEIDRAIRLQIARGRDPTPRPQWPIGSNSKNHGEEVRRLSPGYHYSAVDAYLRIKSARRWHISRRVVVVAEDEEVAALPFGGVPSVEAAVVYRVRPEHIGEVVERTDVDAREVQRSIQFAQALRSGESVEFWIEGDVQFRKRPLPLYAWRSAARCEKLSLQIRYDAGLLPLAIELSVIDGSATVIHREQLIARAEFRDVIKHVGATLPNLVYRIEWV